jgi:hypothetical protein
MKQKYKHLMMMMGNEDRVGRERKSQTFVQRGKEEEESRDEKER